ncbi:hypothetical protein HN014_04190 [Aquimarina sp. TRL1]|uniref:hypothetical protein n=1 Tax=Aquimarina sp. (strain TRL1) TaxID=2736252 RepID=UPI00158F47FD|nr:hypothetical protein [Aquimarina sp. TRL1]QKX04138.1 hypothetical protein HN014_04190 [Aquimarina sp. TRL1]
MIIPIPSNRKRFTIVITIKVKKAMDVGFKVYDPLSPNTHYFRRKAYLERGQKRSIKIPLPVSPEELELEVYDKNKCDDGSLELLDFKVTMMNEPRIWSTPEHQRFMEFAIQFAQKAGYVPAGFYDSPKGEFLFQYLPSIVDAFGKELITPARIHRKMPRVQISQRLFKTYTIPVRVAILSHEGCHWFLNTRRETTADLCGIRHYLDYGFPKIEAVYAATKIFSRHPELVGKTQVDRTKEIVQFIDKYTLAQ